MAADNEIKKDFPLYSGDRGVLGLPMRMVVALIIGGAALGAVTYFMMTHCWTPEQLNVSWEPGVADAGLTTITVTVSDADGDPIKDASVVITGLGGAGSNKTNGTGEAEITINTQIPDHRNQGYLDITAKASGCYKDYSQDKAIKVVEG